MSYGLGIDLGGSSVKAVAVTPDGQVLQRARKDFDPAVRMDWAAEVRALVGRLQREHGVGLSFLGLAAPGLAARDGRSIAHMPGRLAGLEGLDWQEFLGGACPVPVLNDAHAALLGEVWLGAAQGLQNVILLTLGTGVGGAAMVDGRLLRGELGRAGHFGHICLDPDGLPDVCRLPGSLEVQVGNCTLQIRSAGKFRSTHELVAAYQSGDAEAARIWLKSMRALACGVASLINVLDPAAVIVGGGIARAGDALFRPLEEFLREVEWPIGSHRVRILPAALGEFAGACGAAAHARPA